MQQPSVAATPFDVDGDDLPEPAPVSAQGVKQVSAIHGWIAGLLLAAGILAVSYFGTYTPGDDIGYNLGLAGGICMLLLFVYPLKKRVRFLARLGPLSPWFSAHMALGIAGPALVLAHCKLTLYSLNATMAFWSMVLVAGSGIVGRFLYRQIHRGLDGRRRSLDELRARAGYQEGDVNSWLKYLPGVRESLERFSGEAEAALAAGPRGWGAFLLLPWRARQARRRALVALARDLPIIAKAKGWDEVVTQRRLHKGRRLIDTWIGQAKGIGRFTAYERGFALWHVLHLPFVVLLVGSALVHVLYVHMY